MSKKKEGLVESILELQKDMNELSIDKVNEMAPKPEENESKIKLTAKELASNEGIPYIEPRRRLSALGKLPDSMKKLREHDWEYVKGIFENEIVNGEPIKFWLCKWPGDPDCLWEVPANRPCYVPRMVAKHLSGEKDQFTGMQSMVYHKFDYREKPSHLWQPDQETHSFIPTGTSYRGRFRPLGAFS